MLLTVDEVQAYTGSALPEEQLQLLLDAAEEAIMDRYGATTGPLTEVVRGGLSLLTLSRPVAAIASVSETVGNATPVALASNDYYFTIGSEWLRRSIYGDHYSAGWHDLVTVVYTPVDDTNDRKRVQLKLVELDLTNAPGLSAQQIGEVSEQYANNSAMNYSIERELILSSLRAAPGPGFA